MGFFEFPVLSSTLGFLSLVFGFMVGTKIKLDKSLQQNKDSYNKSSTET